MCFLTGEQGCVKAGGGIRGEGGWLEREEVEKGRNRIPCPGRGLTTHSDCQ